MVLDQTTKKVLDIAESASKTAVAFVVDKVFDINHPDYIRAIVEGRSEALRDMAKSDTTKNLIIYEALSQKTKKRQFLNFSSVLEKFSKLVKTDPKEKIRDDNDFFWGLLEHSKTISSEEIQNLIAKIIAGEYNTPGTYSMSTLQILKSLSKNDLDKFSFFASFYLSGHGFFQDFFDMREKSLAIRTKLNINYADFLELQNLGLIQSGNYTMSINVKKDFEFVLLYYDVKLNFKANKDFEKWNFPSCYALTTAGREILQHLKIVKSVDFQEWLKESFKEKEFECL